MNNRRLTGRLSQSPPADETIVMEKENSEHQKRGEARHERLLRRLPESHPDRLWEELNKIKRRVNELEDEKKGKKRCLIQLPDTTSETETKLPIGPRPLPKSSYANEGQPNVLQRNEEPLSITVKVNHLSNACCTFKHSANDAQNLNDMFTVSSQKKLRDDLALAPPTAGVVSGLTLLGRPIYCNLLCSRPS